jgi:xanthine dehydrogenase YagR molybdenum-binding subunit
MNASAQAVGKPLDRVDGRLKVTGGARYAAEARVPGVTCGALVLSTIPSGKVTAFDTAEAERSPGVLAVLDHP